MGVPPFLGDNMRTITAVNESPHKSYGITGVRWPLRSSDVIQGGGWGVLVAALLVNYQFNVHSPRCCTTKATVM